MCREKSSTESSASSADWEDVIVYEDHLDDLEIMRKIIRSQELDEPFHLLDMGDVIKKYARWSEKLPRVEPHYAVKCNPEPSVLKVLSALGASFDCASKQEIVAVTRLGVSPERIIFANPVKTPSHISYSRMVGVRKMTADSSCELAKIRDLFPEARVVLRIRCDDSLSKVKLGGKFGCEPHSEALQLINRCRELSLDLHGFSFHVGSHCADTRALCRGIELCKDLIEVARGLGFRSVGLLDVGGGFPADGSLMDGFWEALNEALANLEPDIRVISEPGRYFTGSAAKAAVRVNGKRTLNSQGGERNNWYFLNDGVHGSFHDHLVKVESRLPRLLLNASSTGGAGETAEFRSTLWGPTCDPFDCIAKDVQLPEFFVGDWLYWSDMGAYTGCFSSDFNGFSKARTLKFIRRSCWNYFLKVLLSEEKFKNISCHQC